MENLPDAVRIVEELELATNAKSEIGIPKSQIKKVTS